MHANVGTATVQAEEDDGVIAMNDGKNRHSRCNYCRNSTDHGWHDCPLRHSHQESDDTYHVNAAQVSSQRECIAHAWCTITENADLENLQLVIGDSAERPPSSLRLMMKYMNM